MARRTPKRNYLPHRTSYLAFLNFNNKLITNSFYLKFEMQYNIPSSSPPHEPGNIWNTPKRARVRQMRRDGKTWEEITKSLGVSRSSARTICKDKSSRTTRQGKQYHHLLLSVRSIRQIIRHIAKGYSNRRLTFKEVRQQLGIPALARTI